MVWTPRRGSTTTATRSRYRFSLATLVVLMLLAALALAVAGSVVRQRRHEGQVAQFFRDRGSVTQTSNGGIWGERVVGLQHTQGMGRTVQVLRAADVARLKELRHLRMLYFEGGVLAPGAITALGQLRQVEQLYLAHLPLSDEQLLALRGMTALRHLDLVNTGVSEQAVAELCRALPQLEVADD